MVIIEWLHIVINCIVELVSGMGYWGIILLMFLESSFFPFPSEVVIIPAGYLAMQGEMNLAIVILCGTIGSLLGAVFNYFLAIKLGRFYLIKYGKYILFTATTMQKMEVFFTKYGSISTFSGRLIPVIRQYISLPAGLARMDVTKFCIYTTLGAMIWVSILALLGYFLGSNMHLVKDYLQWIIIAILIVIVIMIAYYIKRAKHT